MAQTNRLEKKFEVSLKAFIYIKWWDTRSLACSLYQRRSNRPASDSTHELHQWTINRTPTRNSSRGNTTCPMPPFSSRHILFEISPLPRVNVLLSCQVACVQTEWKHNPFKVDWTTSAQLLWCLSVKYADRLRKKQVSRPGTRPGDENDQVQGQAWAQLCWLLMPLQTTVISHKYTSS